VGYGESRPLVANDTPANRMKNRRVEILLLTEGKQENVK
jgi:flagellar motor protein MotB